MSTTVARPNPSVNVNQLFFLSGNTRTTFVFAELPTREYRQTRTPARIGASCVGTPNVWLFEAGWLRRDE
ncbi:hypothetical protein PSAB6_230270 [Paraburkholderia sabiae]|nr:hypothetical protein PSAB6_230270 [Paraburkholderia sabiae]